MIGGMLRRVFHIRHPEHTSIYATKSQLKELRSTLQLMLDCGCPTPIDLDWVDKLIEDRAKSPPKASQAPVSTTESPCTTTEDLDDACRGFQENIEATVVNANSLRMKAVRADPNTKFHTQEFRDKRAVILKRLIAGWFENSTGPFHPEIKMKKQKNFVTTRTRNSTVFDLEGAHGKFSPYHIFTRPRILPPRASDFNRPELLFHLPNALQYLGIGIPENLEIPPSTTERPHRRSGPFKKLPSLYKKQLPTIHVDVAHFVAVQDKLLNMEYPFLTPEEKKAHYPMFRTDEVGTLVVQWAKQFSFAEDVVVTAQSTMPRIKGMGQIPTYVKKSAKWKLGYPGEYADDDAGDNDVE